MPIRIHCDVETAMAYVILNEYLLFRGICEWD